MIYEYNDYRNFLRDEVRTRRNTTMSSFSESVGISNAYLSEVINGKKSFSVEIALKVTHTLNLTPNESQYFCLLVQLDHEKDEKFRQEIKKRLTQVSPGQNSEAVPHDHYKLIADWFHFAILEATFLPIETFSSELLATLFNLPKKIISEAVDRLLRLDLLTLENGRYKKRASRLVATSTTPNEAFRHHYQQVIKKADESLDDFLPHERVSMTDILAFDERHLPEVRRLSEEFSASLMKLSEKAETKTGVYALSLHFFNLTQGNKHDH